MVSYGHFLGKGEKMIVERVTIEWTKRTRNGMEGILTLDRWKDYVVASTPTESCQCKCSVGDGYTGFTSVDGGVVSHTLTEEQIHRVGDLMGAYWDGWTKQKQTYRWFQEKPRTKNSPAMRRKSKDAPFKKRP